MKKTLCILLSIIMVILGASPALASVRVTTISRVTLTVNTASINTGDMLADDATEYVTVEDNVYYELESADWLDTVENLKVGDQPRMRVLLSVYPKEQDYDTYSKIWLFTGSYNSTNVHLTGGELISSTILDSGYTLELTLRIRAIRGSYEAPVDAYWTSQLGTAMWSPSYNDSGYYDVICYRNETVVKQLKSYSGNTYNFYPYMTKAGNYTFKVRCALPPNATSGARVSEYIESGDQEVKAEQVSNGSGQTTSDENGGTSIGTGGNASYPNGTGSANVAGWVTDSSGTYFRYPNGEYARNGWLKVSGFWYLLDSTGKRLIGWQKNPSKTNWFYMDPTTGIMKTGWLKISDLWYYLEPSGASEGAMITGWREIGGKRYYFNTSGVMVTGWYEIGGSWYYFWPQGARSDGTYGYMATNTKVGDFVIGADGTWQH